MKAASPVLVAVLLLGVPYVGAYLSLVTPTPPAFTGFSQKVADYRIGGNYAVAFFAPLEWADRNVRPGYWEYDEFNGI